jgi:hypothetical protein
MSSLRIAFISFRSGNWKREQKYIYAQAGGRASKFRMNAAATEGSTSSGIGY